MGHSDQPPDLNLPITVMIVDDDHLVCATVARLLGRRRDLRVIEAFTSGFAALDAAVAQPPNVMVVDISMPAMGGRELTLRGRELLAGTRFIAYTSLADERSISGVLQAGAAGVVYKDAPVEALADAIRATHAGLSVLSPRFCREHAQPRPVEDFSETEATVLHLVSLGMTNDQIAQRVGLSASTVKYHIARLSERLGANNRVTLAVAAVQLGLAGSPPMDRDG